MRVGRYVLPLVVLFLFYPCAFAKEVPFTLEDRDRLIRLETKVDEGLKSVNHRIDALDKRIDALDKRIDSLDKRIDGLQNLIYVVISGIFILIGFVIWDRRTALAPAIKKNKELEEREERIERALKELAKEDPKVASILRNVGLL